VAAEAELSELRRAAEELSVAVADSGALVERLRLLQDELTARLNEATNRLLYILTIVTAIAAPIEFVPALFGVNVAGIPFAEYRRGFWMVLLVTAAVIVLGAAIVRRWVRRSQ
jgi:zinc transporter